MSIGRKKSLWQTRSLAGYLIDQSGIDWSKKLASWFWLLPTKSTRWLVTRFADLFLVLPDGTVHMLEAGVGTLAKVSESREEFGTQID